MKIYLSHFLGASTPGFAGHCSLSIAESSSIQKGRNSNSLDLKLNNHTGTHIDLPRHFHDQGKSLNDYPPEFWFFRKVFLLTLTAQADQIIDVSDLNLASVPKDTEFLLIKTGFEIHRGEEIYWKNNPGFSPALGHYLRENFPALRSIGFDSISLTALQHKALGKEAHLAFLAGHKNLNPIVIVEDMKLGELKSAPKELICLPLLVDNADGGPVSVIAEI